MFFNLVRIGLLCFLTSLVSIVASSQQSEYIFKNFTQEEGLPSNEAYFVFEDSRHFLWFATDLGVVRYNGSKFEKFNLPDKVVFKIKEDHKGRIWFFSHTAQLAYFENEKINTYKYNNKIADRIKNINIVDAYVDNDENIYLSSSTDSNYHITKEGLINSYNHVIYKGIHPSEFTIKNTYLKDVVYTENVSRCACLNETTPIFIKLTERDKITNFQIPNLMHSSSYLHFGCTKLKENYYFFAANFIIKLSSNGANKVKFLPGQILCILAEEENIRIGMHKEGSLILDSNLNSIADRLLANKSVTSIHRDFEGGIWFSTLESGIFYMKNSKISNALKLGNGNDENVSRLLNYKDESLIFTNSAGVNILSDNRANQLISQKNINISDLRIDTNKNILCFGGILDSGNAINRKKAITNDSFRNAYFVNSLGEVILSGDSVIICTPDKIVVQKVKENISSNISKTNLVLFNKPLKLFLDNSKQVWGGNQDGLYKSGIYFNDITPVNASYAPLKKGVNCIRQMNNGLIVVGIRFGGVAILNDTNIIANITESDGLLSDKIRYLLPIKDQLWVATAMGISVIKFTSYNPIKYSIINIGKNDGFYNVTINQLIQFKGEIVAATSNGLYFIKDPDELINRKPIPIPFYINSVSYYKNDTSAVNSLDLPYAKNRVLLRYSAACFNSAEEVKYQYTFSSADTGWITTTSSELLLENLEPGDYDFRIKAVIPNQNRSSEVQHFHITVQKPWWQNNWFRAAVIMCFIGAGIAFSRYRIKKVQADEERKTALNAKIAELEQTALRAQMNPHFIFNCLTSIQQLIVTGDKTEANEYLVKFARLIRKTLDLSANPFISIKDEMEYLAEYMFLEQLRITGRFEYFIDADKTIDTEKMLIPNMMIQPVVENCIRHGIKSLEHRKGIINVHFKINEGKLTCTVKDNGIGRKNSANESADLIKHKSYGIDIIEKRLKVFEELNNEQMGVEIKDLFNDDATPAGTEVILQLPYKITV